jgi:methylated-DNA-[protein]-cysteine S-methyltransferase
LLAGRDPSADDAAALRLLRQRLTVEARSGGLLDVAYRIVESPFGDLLLAATPIGLARVAFAHEDHDAVLERLAEQISPRILHDPSALDSVARELDEYFTGARRAFDVSVDLRLAQGFRLEVLTKLPSVGYGHTVSYGSLAADLGRPRASRAVGTACATNPVPLVVPCHRVVRADGSTGEYAGGAEMKRVLLRLEAS